MSVDANGYGDRGRGRAAGFSPRGLTPQTDRPLRPPDDLPVDPRTFWSATAALDSLAAPTDGDTTSPLRRLGPLPLARGGFPLMGFLSTVYEEVAGHAKATAQPEDGAPEESWSDRGGP